VSTPDGRSMAWLRSYHLIGHAQELRQSWIRSGPAFGENLPPIYYAILQEAEILTQMSLAPPEVGFVAGDNIQRDWDARVEMQTERTAAAFESIFDQKKDEPETFEKPEGVDPVCACSWSRKHCLVHPWPPKDEE
jgi:hypothetical protein